MNRESGHNFEEFNKENTEIQEINPIEIGDFDVEEVLNNVEPDENKEEARTFLKFSKLIEKFKDAKEKIEDKIIETFNISDEEIDDFVFNVSYGHEAGEAAGKKFNLLLLKSLVKPDEYYTHENYPNPTSYINRIKKHLIRKKINSFPHQYIKNKKRVIDSIYTERQPDFSESEEVDYTSQRFEQRVKQELSDNILAELVMNQRDDEFNSSFSVLHVYNSKTGRILNLNLLLPNNVNFVPATMSYNFKDQKVIQSESENSNELSSKDLKDYKGAQNDISNEFAFVASYSHGGNDKLIKTNQEVRYGDLTKTGGMLSLLHEITHSWQQQVRSKGGKHDYKKYLSSIKVWASIYLDHLEAGELDAKQFSSETLKEKGMKIGEEAVNTDEARFILNDIRFDSIEEEYEKEEIKITDYGSIQLADIPIASDKLKSLIESYVEEERNAWANAIKIIRLLRKHGFDLEPNLKTLEDFRNQFENPLESYDRSILNSDFINRPSNVRRFKRLRDQ